MSKELELPQSVPVEEQKLLQKIMTKYSDFAYHTGSKFTFRPPKTIILGPFEPHYSLLFCHELGHALSGEDHFDTDVERLKIERLAWDKAQELCTEFHIPYDEEFVEEQLDSYRDWLHSKSKCPQCGLTRYQTKNGQYHCPHCDLTV